MRIKRFLAVATALFLVFPFSSCSDKTDVDSGSGGNENPRKEIVLSAAEQGYVQAGNDFAFDFLRRVNASEKGNYVVSPLSLQLLLGMLLDAAGGQTADDICAVLGYGSGQDGAVDAYALKLLTLLPKLDQKTTLSLAGAVVFDRRETLLEEYRSRVEQYYGTKFFLMDFSDTQAALDAINGWCSKQTHGLIPKILDRIDPDLLACLMNALYFKGAWSLKFDKARTKPEPFTRSSGEKTSVPMMRCTGDFAYSAREGVWRMLRLPFGNGAYSMLVLLPEPGKGVADILASLDAASLAKAMRAYPVETDLWLPRFDVTTEVKLNDLLGAMGMGRAFVPGADFKHMSPAADHLDFVKQNAVIKVDETGAEAAAVTSAGVYKETSVGPSEPLVFHADRTFLYLIVEQSTGAVLFGGRYDG